MSAWRVKEMCDNCPFAKSGKGLALRKSLMPGRWREIQGSLRQGGVFECHKTVDYDDEDGEGITGSGLFCAGALEWLDEKFISNQYVRIAERLGAMGEKGK